MSNFAKLLKEQDPLQEVGRITSKKHWKTKNNNNTKKKKTPACVGGLGTMRSNEVVNSAGRQTPEAD